MRQAITTWAALQLYKYSQKKYLFEIEPSKRCTGWAAVAGKAYYRIVWAGIPYSDTGVSRVLQDGAELTKVGSLATCDSTAGSWRLEAGYLYVHATGGGSPSAFTMLATAWQCFATHKDCIFQPSWALYPVPYKALIAADGVPSFTATDEDIVSQGASLSIGQLTLLNGRNKDYGGLGPLDVSLDTLNYTRARCRCLIGGEQLPYSEYQLYWAGMVDTVEPASAKIDFSIMSSRQALDYKYPPEVYALNRKAFYEFSAAALTTDSSGNSHTLTAIGDPASDPTGPFGGGVALDSDDAYSIADHADFKPTVPFEVSGYFKKAVSEAYSGIMQCFSDNSGTAISGWRVYLEAGHLVLLSGRNTGTVGETDWASVVGGTDVCDGVFHSFTAAWNGTHLVLAVDGIQEADPHPWTHSPGYGASPNLRLGCLSDDGTNGAFFTGSLERIAIMHEKLMPGAEGLTIPTIFGSCSNIKPQQVNTWSWKFNCASHRINKLSAVREAGIDKTADISALTLSDATFLLTSYAEGRTLTCDVQGLVNGSGTYLENYGAIALYLLAMCPEITSADYDYTAFTAFDATYPRKIGLYLTAATPVRETLKLLNESVCARIVQGRDGKLRPVKYGLPAASAVASFDLSSVAGLTPRILQNQLYWKVRIGYGKNWTVQPDTAAGGVSVREDWSWEYRWEQAYSDASRYSYGCQDARDIPTLLATQYDALAVANEYLALVKNPWLEITFDAPTVPYGLQIGNTIDVTDGRNFPAGSMFIVTKIIDNARNSNVSLTARAPCDGTINLI